jgi:transcriptional regulator with XRE-family HTH domain
VTSRDRLNGNLAAAIIRLRQQVGSQVKLANAVGTTERTVKRWEKGVVPQAKFRPALTDLGVDERLFARAEMWEEVEARLRDVEAEIARIRELRG